MEKAEPTSQRPTEQTLSYEDLLYRYQEERIKAQKLAHENLKLSLQVRGMKRDKVRVNFQYEAMKRKLQGCEDNFKMITNIENQMFTDYAEGKPSNDGIVCLIGHMRYEARQGIRTINAKMEQVSI